MNNRRVTLCWSLCLLAVVWLTTAAPTWGQNQIDPPATRKGMEIRGPQGNQPALPSVVSSSQTYYVQGIVVVALFGGALWAVCHSCRRG